MAPEVSEVREPPNAVGHDAIDGRLAERHDNPEPLSSLAEAGDAAAAIALARHTGDLEPLIALAEAGDLEAAIELANRYGRAGPLDSLASWIEPPSAFFVFRRMREYGRTQTAPVALKFLCVSARGGDPDGFFALGHLHTVIQEAAWPFSGSDWLRAAGVHPDDRVAYMWYAIAAAHGHPNGQRQARSIRERLNNYQLAQAEQLVRHWKPDDCPRPITASPNI